MKTEDVELARSIEAIRYMLTQIDHHLKNIQKKLNKNPSSEEQLSFDF